MSLEERRTRQNESLLTLVQNKIRVLPGSSHLAIQTDSSFTLRQRQGSRGRDPTTSAVWRSDRKSVPVEFYGALAGNMACNDVSGVGLDYQQDLLLPTARNAINHVAYIYAIECDASC